MIRRGLRHAGTCFVLIAVSFAQAAAAANACLQWRSTPAVAVTAPQSAHCDSEKKANLNLCFYQCADQSDQNTLQPVIAASTAPILTLPDAAIHPRVRVTSIVASNTGHDPPIPIRFCSFLN